MNENKSYKNMELKFNKNGDAYVAEFEATDKFNLHMEGLLLGSFSILQRTAGGNYTHVRDIPTYPRFDKVFDYDFEALVYPKFIKIVSEVEPTYAEVVSDGEITEIKSQTKEVEITANGTTQVAPDAGFSYLTGVTVKTNVPQSGGSGGGVVEDENTRVIKGNDFYWRMPDAESEYYSNACLMIASGIEFLADVVYEGVIDNGVSKLIVGGGCFSGIAGIAAAGKSNLKLSAFREKSFSSVFGDYFFPSIVEAFMFIQGTTEENALAFMTQLGFTRITKEEFYNLES